MTAAPDFSRIPPDPFQRALAFTLSWERGKADDPADHGGRTLDGITQHTYDAYRTARGLARRDVFQMEDPERDDIYRRMYWDAVAGDAVARINPRLATCVFDTAVNSGPGVAAKRLQRTIRMPQEAWDGVIGRVTLSKLRIRLLDRGPDEVIAVYLELRMALYRSILLRDKTQLKFRNGWRNRLNDLAAHVGLPEPIWEDYD